MVTVGFLLKKQRLKKGLSLKEVEKKLRIRERFLRAVEENNWDVFVSRVYAQGVVKNYASFLGIKEEKIMPYFRRDYERYEEVHVGKKLFRKPLFLSISRPTKIAISIVSLLFASFLAYQLILYFKPPKVEIYAPPKKFIETKAKEYVVKGRVEKDTEVKINGEVVYPDPEGYFEQKIVLYKGKNSIEIKAVGSNSRTSLKKFVILRK